MKIYISCDMEGVTGVSNWDQTFIQGNQEEFGRARLQMTREVNAAVEGALTGGATSALVCDAHGHGTSLLLEEIHPRAELITGSPTRLGMVEGLDGSFQAAFFIGYHSSSGTPGVLNHSYTGAITHFVINDIPVGELGLGALMAWSQGVPAALVTGDSQTVTEARSLLGSIRTVCTKESTGRYSAASRTPGAVLDEIRRVARQAVDETYLRSLQPLDLKGSIKVEMGFLDTHLADQAARVPGAEKTGSRSVSIVAPEYPQAVEAILAMMYLGWT